MCAHSSRAQSVMVGRPGQWGLGAGGQIASTVGKQSEMTPGAQLTVCFLFSPGLHPMEWCHPHLQ